MRLTSAQGQNRPKGSVCRESGPPPRAAITSVTRHAHFVPLGDLSRCSNHRRLLALEDASDIAGRPAELIDEIRPVGDQSAGDNEVACGVDPWQLTAGRQLDDQIAVNSG
jgi:hypothetical protein